LLQQRANVTRNIREPRLHLRGALKGEKNSFHFSSVFQNNGG
jgi:hypothetical protein